MSRLCPFSSYLMLLGLVVSSCYLIMLLELVAWTCCLFMLLDPVAWAIQLIGSTHLTNPCNYQLHFSICQFIDRSTLQMKPHNLLDHVTWSCYLIGTALISSTKLSNPRYFCPFNGQVHASLFIYWAQGSQGDNVHGALGLGYPSTILEILLLNIYWSLFWILSGSIFAPNPSPWDLFCHSIFKVVFWSRFGLPFEIIVDVFSSNFG